MTITARSVLLCAAAALPAAAIAGTADAPAKALIAHQFQVWNAALQSGEPDKVAALYCEPGGILIPTISNVVRTTRAGITGYFKYFLALRPRGKIDKAYIRILGPDTAVDSGIYTFHLVKNGKPEDVQARYTFVYQKVHGRWCIMDHHSSAMPESGTK